MHDSNYNIPKDMWGDQTEIQRRDLRETLVRQAPAPLEEPVVVMAANAAVGGVIRGHRRPLLAAGVVQAQLPRWSARPGPYLAGRPATSATA